MALPIVFEGLTFEEGFRAELIVNQSVIIEVMSVETDHQCGSARDSRTTSRFTRLPWLRRRVKQNSPAVIGRSSILELQAGLCA